MYVSCVCMCVCVCWCVCVCVYRDRESFLRVEVDEQMCRVRNGACHASPPTVVAVYCNFSANRERFYISPFSLFFPPRFFLLLFAPLFLSILSQSPVTIPVFRGKKLEKIMLMTDLKHRKNIKFRAIRMVCGIYIYVCVRVYIYIYVVYTSAWNMLTRPIVYSERSLFTGLGDCVASVLID